MGIIIMTMTMIRGDFEIAIELDISGSFPTAILPGLVRERETRPVILAEIIQYEKLVAGIGSLKKPKGRTRGGMQTELLQEQRKETEAY